MTDQAIYLRPFEEADVTDEYLSWFRDGTVVKWLEARNLSRESVLDFWRGGCERQDQFIYSICDSETKAHIGNVKIGKINKKYLTSDLVTFIGVSDFWGKGLGSSAIKLGNQIAFENHKIKKLWGAIISANVGSIKAYTKADWIIEGVMKNQYYIDGKFYDRVIVSCFNPNIFPLVGISKNCSPSTIKDGAGRLLTKTDHFQFNPVSLFCGIETGWVDKMTGFQEQILLQSQCYELEVHSVTVKIEIAVNPKKNDEFYLGVSTKLQNADNDFCSAFLDLFVEMVPRCIFSSSFFLCSLIKLKHKNLSFKGTLKRQVLVQNEYKDGYIYHCTI